jgi:hypothetical protein
MPPRTTKDGEQLTPHEVSFIKRGLCPDCEHPELLEGPSGGSTLLIKCGNAECDSRFNISPFGIDRISDVKPGPPSKPVVDLVALRAKIDDALDTLFAIEKMLGPVDNNERRRTICDLRVQLSVTGYDLIQGLEREAEEVRRLRFQQGLDSLNDPEVSAAIDNPIVMPPKHMTTHPPERVPIDSFIRYNLEAAKDEDAMPTCECGAPLPSGWSMCPQCESLAAFGSH